MDNMIRKSMCVLMLLVVMTAGCGTSPSVHYYGLDTIDIAYTKDLESSPVLTLGPIRMPEYLKRSQMVTRGSSAEIIVDDFNRWAEPLGDAVNSILASNVDSLLKSMIVVAYPSAALMEVDYRLVGRIVRFDSGKDGLIVLEVQWGAADTGGNAMVTPRRGRYESEATVPGDAGAIALAMSDALAQFSRDIASEIESAGIHQTD